MSSPLTGIGQLHITVSDLETSVAFYRDVLGLPHLFTVEGQPMAFFQAGSVRLYLGETPDERFRSRPVVYYAVDDLEAAYAEVTGRGARVDGATAPGAPGRHDRAVDGLRQRPGRHAGGPDGGAPGGLIWIVRRAR